MKHFRVTVLVHLDGQHRDRKIVMVEAGNKKLAHLRAMQQVNSEGYSNYFKTIESIDEV